MIQRTLILMKPDAVSRGICGEVLSRFERVGLKIVATKMARPSAEFFFKHYETIGQLLTRRGKDAFDRASKMMLTGPVMAVVLEGCEAPELVRKMVGATEPKAAAPGTIRGDYANMSYAYADSIDMGVLNVIHASGNAEEALQEIALWFTADEMVSY
jgi:nucleoside-diphosphate kinase